MSSRLQELNFLERLKKTLQLIESSFENDEYVKKIVKSNKKENEKELLLIKHLNSNVVKKILSKKDLVKINKFFSFQYIEKNHVKINNLAYNLSNYNLLFFDNIYYKNKELLKLFISSKSDLTIWFKKFPKEFFIGFLKEYISELFSLRENTGNSRFKNNIVSLNYYFVELYKYNFISFQELLLDKYNINCFISYEFVNNIAYYLSFDELQELILKIGTFSSEEKNLLVSNYIKVNPRKMSLNYFLDRLDRKMVLLNFEDESLCYQF